MDRKTKIINIMGGPGSGKSTLAAALFSIMKQDNVSCENIYEKAKSLTWAKNYGDLACQPYVFGCQLLKQVRLLGKVDYVITDSPLVLSVVYNRNYSSLFEKSVMQIFSEFDNTNILLNRTFKYDEMGRNETYIEALKIDTTLANTLDRHNVDYYKVFVKEGDSIEAAREIYKNLKKF